MRRRRKAEKAAAARTPVVEAGRTPVGCGFVRAVTIVDGDLRYLEHPDPVPGDTEVVVAVRAAGINNADLMQRLGALSGAAGITTGHPGYGARRRGRRHGPAGPPGSRSAIGSWPWWVEVRRPSWPSWTSAPPWRCRRDLSWPEAGGFPEAFSTAHDALFTQCGLVDRRAGARHRCRGRGRERRGAAGRAPRAPAAWPRSATPSSATRSPPSGPWLRTPTRRSSSAPSTSSSSSSGRRASRGCSVPWPSPVASRSSVSAAGHELRSTCWR